MAKYTGKDFLIQRQTSIGVYQTVAGMRSTSLTINAEAVDVTDKGDSNWRQLLDGCGIMSMEIALAGIFSDSASLATAVSDTISNTSHIYRLTSGRGDKFEGSFKIANLQRSGEYNQAEQYTMSLSSASNITYTPAP